MSFTSPDATAIVDAVLRRYGLESLSEWAWQRVAQGATAAEFELELRERPEFRTRFRAIFEREAAGLPPISPEEVLDYERRRRQVMRSVGFPEGFYDEPDDAVDGLVNDVSINELEQRASMWVEYAQSTYAPDVRATLSRFGFSDGSLAAFLMDEDRALPLLQRQLATSEVAARAARFGFDLTATEADRVAEVVDPADATQRFAALAEASPVLGDRLGDQQGGLDRDTLIGIAAADPTALRDAERRINRSTSTFRQSPGAAATNRGLGGLGTAT